MYALEIAHPNEMIFDKWHFIEEFSDESDIVHHLSSPSFEVQENLLVRVTRDSQRIYTGFYHQNDWISLDHKANRIWDDGVMLPSYDVQWKDCKNASTMLHTINGLVDHVVMIRCLLAIVGKVYFFDNVVLKFMAESVAEYLDKKIDLRKLNDIHKDFNQFALNNPREDRPYIDIFSAVDALTDYATKRAYNSHSVPAWVAATFSLNGNGGVVEKLYLDVQKDLSNDVRRLIPFSAVLDTISVR